MSLYLTGFHHLTAVSADIRENRRFYTGELGLRLVKRSVNQDDVRAYHLFYADAAATPGTDVTFFDWRVPREVRGGHSLTRTGLRVPGASLTYWQSRFAALGVRHGEIGERDGRASLDFEDPEGQRLSLVADDPVSTARPAVPWPHSPVPPEHQLLGLGPITMTVPNLRTTDLVLRKVMNLRPLREYPDPDSPSHRVHVYEMGDPAATPHGPHAELHVAVRPDLPPARPGAGGVHHVAFRTPDEDSYLGWVEHFRHFGLQTSGPVDRYYFRSLYFREPGGVLFEIATDGPGFAVDEDPATLGEKTVLPPFLESRRAEIEAGLQPLD